MFTGTYLSPAEGDQHKKCNRETNGKTDRQMVRQRDEWSHRQQRSEPNSEKAEASRWSADLRELTLHMITIYLEKRSTRVNSMQIYWNVNAKVTSPFCRKGEVIVTTIFFKFQDIATSRSHGSVKHSVTTGSRSHDI